MPASIRTGAGTTTRAAASFSTGSATTATSPTGDWGSTSAARLKYSVFGEFPPANAVWNVALKYTVECTYRKEVTGYPNDVSLTIGGGSPAISMGTKWIGTDGWVWVDRNGFEASNPDWVKMDSLPDNQRKIPLYESSEHRRNFVDSVKSRKAHHHAGRRGASLADSRPPRPHLHARGPQAPLGCEAGEDPQRP